MRSGAGLKGAAARRAQTTQAPQGASGASDRGAQRVCARLAAGALEGFAADPSQLFINERPGFGVSSAEPLSAYKRLITYKSLSEIFLASFAKCTGRDSRERSERESGRGTTERSAPAEI
ncbi:hypothetical protein GCM10009060_23730 [Halorubrum trapanicum]